MVREAEAKKALERKKINRLRKTFLSLQHKNEELPATVMLQKEVAKLLYTDFFACANEFSL